MKRCPQCNRVETDDALTFCRVDGTPLIRESEESNLSVPSPSPAAWWRCRARLRATSNKLRTKVSGADEQKLARNYAANPEASAKTYELTGRQEYASLARESFSKGGWHGYLRAMMTSRTDLRAFTRAVYHAELGEKDKAFAELNTAYENREAILIRLRVDPRLDPLRDDPRFQGLLQRVGFSR